MWLAEKGGSVYSHPYDLGAYENLATVFELPCTLLHILMIGVQKLLFVSWLFRLQFLRCCTNQ